MYMDMAEVLLYAAEVSTILTFPATLLGIWLAVRPPDRKLRCRRYRPRHARPGRSPRRGRRGQNR
jgi:hypothetical protein